MKSWYQPPDLHYSFKSHFAWPNPAGLGEAAAAAGPATEAAAAATAAAAGGAGGGHPPYGPRGYYHGQGYGYGRGYHWRPRFGLFRRAVWFGLGVGAASWYIHHKQEQREARAAYGIEDRPKQYSWSWSYPSENHNAYQAPPTISNSVSTPPEPVKTVQQPIEKRCGWAGRREAKRKEKEEAATLKMEAQETKAAVEKAWADRKKEAEAAQDKVNHQAREAAKQKLEVLSQAVEKMRQALNEAEAGKDHKLV